MGEEGRAALEEGGAHQGGAVREGFLSQMKRQPVQGAEQVSAESGRTKGVRQGGALTKHRLIEEILAANQNPSVFRFLKIKLGKSNDIYVNEEEINMPTRGVVLNAEVYEV